MMIRYNISHETTIREEDDVCANSSLVEGMGTPTRKHIIYMKKRTELPIGFDIRPVFNRRKRAMKTRYICKSGERSETEIHDKPL